MKPTLNFTSIILLLFSLHLKAQTITVEGNVKILNENSHSNISVLFQRIAPSFLNYTFNSDENGDYSGEIEQGFYDIKFYASGCFDYNLKDIQLYENTTIDNVVLQKVTSFIRVPENFQTIQEAIEVANQGDTVFIAPGVYQENLVLLDKPILLASQYIFTGDSSDISNTIIDGSNSGSVISMANETNNPTILKGLSLRNGNAMDIEFDGYPYIAGGGIYCWYGSLTIDHCKIYSNRSEMGGGIYFSGHTLHIDNTEIKGNYSSHQGGGIDFSASYATVNNTMIYENTASYQGGGMFIDAYSALDIINCNVCNNTVASGGAGSAGIHIFNRKSFFNITNSIVANNVGGEGIKCYQGDEYPHITNCNVWNNSKGNLLNCDPHCGVIVSENANGDPVDAFNNISLDPAFEDIEKNDFTLRVESPCIDAGINNTIETDFVGNPRISDGDNNGTSIIDLGVFEYISNILRINFNMVDDTLVNIYPIPAYDIFYLESKETTSGTFILELFDMTGKPVKLNILDLYQGSYKIPVRVDDLVPGFYIGRLLNGLDIQEFTIIISK